MPRKGTQPSTARRREEEPPQPPDGTSSDAEPEPPPPGRAGPQAPAPADTPSEETDNRSLEEILNSIPPPPPPAMTNEAGAPRLMITHIVNQNFKSYAGEKILGPFHKRFSCIIGPNGSGKSNIIDSMLFVFGYRAQKIRSKKLSVLIHNSDEHKDIQSCTVEVHFQKIIDKEGDDYEVIPNSNFYVSRTAYRDNTSVYHISGKKTTFKDVGNLLRSHGIDLDHNRFLILQGEVEQIAMMKPKGQTEHDEGMLEYLEDIIGCGRLNEPIKVLCRRVEILNEHRGEKLNRVKMVEKEKDALEGEKNIAIEFLTLENEMFRKKNHVCQYYIHDLQKRVAEMETQKEKINEDTKEINEKSNILSNEMKAKSKAVKDVEKKLNKITKFIEENKEKFTKLDLEDVQVREKLKHASSKAKKLEKQLQKDKEKVEEFESIPAKSENIITETTARNNALEKEKEKEEGKLKEVMDSLKQETQGLQKEKEMAVWAKKMNKIQTPENTPRLFDLVKVKDEEIRQAFYFALRDTLVADNLDQATRVAYQKDRRWRVVTLQGQIIEQSGTMTGGGSKVMKGRMGSSVVEISEEEVNKMESQLQRDSQKAVQIQEQKVQLEEVVVKLKHSQREMRNTLEKFTASIQRLSEQEEYLNVQVKELEANVLATAPDKKKQKLLEENVSAFKTEYDNVAKRAGKIEAEVKRLHNIIVEINNHKLKAQQDKLDKINKQLDECASAITKAQVAIKTADRNLKKAQDSVFRTEKEIKDTAKEIDDLTAELKSLEEKATEVIKSTNAAEETLPEIQQEHRNLLKELKVIQENEHALQKDALSIKLKLEQIDGHIAEHNSKIRYWQKEISKIKLNPIEDNPVEEISVLSPEDLEAIKNPDSITNQIALLEAQCHEMKPNLGAIAEYKKKEELYLQRVAELDKITYERDNFRQAYEDLRKQRLNEFMAGFYIITNKLKENYQMLTLGGDAELELVDSLDPFSEGIMFSVRPPKKSWKKIFNLSGGEKTLSSLALVFALHHYKPTPLYFMDEIDAALDFKNVSIVAFYIYEQTKNAQFIIISLRNNMFEISDRLIGIYKTYNITKSVAVNPKEIASKGLC
ncbi:structural maintenance of chromosomes protein 4 isoform 2-T2 [Hipposideros larvatus]|uniref:Structural maintenance of chromosomes protein 4 n=1 Tax=Hipposideros armiger TaxID=186990 RepID=A0A8B7Q3T8_HIPAR|nr:PREDICTED: structural maintenance of chromosomes protein 4 isoform X2 [Hipposideros armiger]